MVAVLTVLPNYPHWNVLLAGGVGVGVFPAGAGQLAGGRWGLHSYQLLTQFSAICQVPLQPTINISLPYN